MSVSKDYDKFNLLEYNRNLDRNQINKLKESISIHGYLSSNPIIVDQKLNIVDGQHRFVACKDMGLPIVYEVIDNSTDMIIDLNTTQKKWSLKDYVNYYAIKEKNENYARLNNAIKECNTTYDVIITIAYRRATAGSISQEIKAGKLKFNREDEIRTLETYAKIKDIATYLRLKTGGKFAAALCILSQEKNFRWERMLTQSYKYPTLAYPCRTTEEYKKMFTDLYNFNSRTDKTRIGG